jgi:hypothetical protein
MPAGKERMAIHNYVKNTINIYVDFFLFNVSLRCLRGRNEKKMNKQTSAEFTDLQIQRP